MEALRKKAYKSGGSITVTDMADYDCFADIFEEKPVEEWNTMGAYTMLLKGLHTPVLVNMNGMDALSVSAHGQTVELGDAGMATLLQLDEAVTSLPLAARKRESLPP